MIAYRASCNSGIKLEEEKSGKTASPQGVNLTSRVSAWKSAVIVTMDVSVH